ncbi:hypothetical protein BZA77DRAFT_63522 [Pyronema omphalodes]|nr:hypothetical protein BZA77DRAFT_63522 [Pyronema omphalodes]
MMCTSAIIQPALSSFIQLCLALDLFVKLLQALAQRGSQPASVIPRQDRKEPPSVSVLKFLLPHAEPLSSPPHSHSHLSALRSGSLAAVR